MDGSEAPKAASRPPGCGFVGDPDHRPSSTRWSPLTRERSSIGRGAHDRFYTVLAGSHVRYSGWEGPRPWPTRIDARRLMARLVEADARGSVARGARADEPTAAGCGCRRLPPICCR